MRRGAAFVRTISILAVLAGGCREKATILDGGDSRGNDGAGGNGGDPERCGNGIDDNGDGRIDEGCACVAGTTQACYRGKTATRHVGACHDGTQTCASGDGGAAQGRWGDCTGDQEPVSEMCGADGNGDTIDQDCNGAADDACRCSATANPLPRECPGGPLLGECRHGTQICGLNGKWSACDGQVPPRPEICSNGKDDDCNGMTDDACAPPDAAPEPAPDLPADLPAPDLPVDPLQPDLAPDAPAEPPLVDAPEGCGDLPAPRLVAPLSTARVTQQRPTLHWELAPGTDGARIDLCKELSCATILETIDAIGDSTAPAADLPAGVVYWRAYGKSGSSVGCTPNHPWEFFVNRRSAAGPDTSWGTVLDVNEDGFADLVISAPGAASAYVHLGGAGGLDASASATLAGPSAEAFGGFWGHGAQAVASAGDVNGDGYADVIVSAPGDFDSTGPGSVFIYMGGPAGLATTPAATIDGPTSQSHFGCSVASAGDVNGDGYADVVVGAYFAPGAVAGAYGSVSVFLGGPTGLSTTAATTLLGDAPMTNFGYSVANAGDVNGDGFADVAVAETCFCNAMGDGRAFVYLGGAGGLATAPLTLTIPMPIEGGGPEIRSVANAGDVNGDGYADLLANNGGHHVARVYVYLGGGGGTAASPATTLAIGMDATKTEFGAGMTGIDVDGDGYWDVALGSPYLDQVFLYAGGPAGVNPTPVAVVNNDPEQGFFGYALSGADVDGDTREDLAVGAFGAPGPPGTPGPGIGYIFLGSPGGITTSPALKLTGAAVKDQFGVALSISASGS